MEHQILNEKQIELAQEIGIDAQFVPLIEKHFGVSAENALFNGLNFSSYETLYEYFYDVHYDEGNPENLTNAVSLLWNIHIAEDRNEIKLLDEFRYLVLPNGQVVESRF